MSLTRSILICCIGFCLCINVAVAQHQVVLVASSTSPLHELNSIQLRKIYLGFSVQHDGKTIRGLRNTTDNNLNKIFLQTVVAMSEKAYTRRQLAQTLRQGIPRVAEYDESEKLLAALSKNQYSITYMWMEDAKRMPDVKVLRVLWDKE